MSEPQVKQVYLEGTTNASGGATVTSSHSILGWLLRVKWVDGDLADGVDAVLSVTNTEDGVDETLLTLTDANSDAIYYPRDDEHDNTGSALSTTTLMLINGVLQMVITSGGDTKTGGMVISYHSR